MIGAFDDHLMGADASLCLVKHVAAVIPLAARGERGILVRYYAHRPARPVNGAAVSARGPYFGRSHRFVARTERAGFGVALVRCAKLARPMSTIGGNNHPTARDRIFAKL